MVFVPEAKCMCITCIEHRTSAVHNTHVSASVGSTSTSSLTTTTPSTPPTNIAPGSSTMFGFPLPISTSTPSPWGTPPHAPAFGTPSPSCFGTPCVSSRPVSHTEPTQLFRHNGYGICESTAPISGTMQAPVQASSAWATTTTSSTSSPFPSQASSAWASLLGTPSASASKQSPKQFGFPPQASTSLFGTPAPITSFGSASTQSPFGFGSFAAPKPFGFPFQSSSAFGNGVGFARPDVAFSPAASKQTTNTVVFGTTPVNVPSVFAPSIPKSPFSSSFPPFGDSYFPGTGANSLRSSPFTGGCRTVSATQSTFTGIPSGGFNYGAREGSRHTRYAPTPEYLDPAGNLVSSISASGAYRHKSHEELRWEDYRNGDKGDSRPNAVSHSTFASNSDKSHEELRWGAYKQRETGVSMPNTTVNPPTVSPSLFPPRSMFDNPQGTKQGNMFSSLPTGPSISASSEFNVVPTPSTTIPTAPVTSSVQRPHETNDVSSSHTSGCTACGAASSPSPSGYSIFNGPATPPPFFSNAGYYPMMFGGMAPAFQAYPMMFGTNMPGQGTTTSAMQAYPVQGFLILPFAAMNLQ